MVAGASCRAQRALLNAKLSTERNASAASASERCVCRNRGLPAAEREESARNLRESVRICTLLSRSCLLRAVAAAKLSSEAVSRAQQPVRGCGRLLNECAAATAAALRSGGEWAHNLKATDAGGWQQLALLQGMSARELIWAQRRVEGRDPLKGAGTTERASC